MDLANRLGISVDEVYGLSHLLNYFGYSVDIVLVNNEYISVAINGGIIGKAQDAKTYYEGKGDEFNKFTANTVTYIDGYLNEAKTTK